MSEHGGGGVGGGEERMRGVVSLRWLLGLELIEVGYEYYVAEDVRVFLRTVV